VIGQFGPWGYLVLKVCWGPGSSPAFKIFEKKKKKDTTDPGSHQQVMMIVTILNN